MALGDTHPSFSDLDQLLSIITAGVHDIKRAYVEADQPFPDFQKPYTPNATEQSAPVMTQIALVVAAASQLVRTLRSPAQTVIEETLSGPMRSAAIGALMKLHIPERLREAGPQGATAHELCSAPTANASKVARLLRLLTSRHIFREVRPGVFAHNRISSVFDTGNSVQHILSNPAEKFNNSNGVSALAEMYGTHALQAASMIPDHMSDSSWCMSDKQDHAPLCQALGFQSTLWDYYGRPENATFQARFNAAMTEVGKLHPPRSILEGFPWSELAPDSTVVDVGGGVGIAVFNLMQEHPNLRYVVQDLPPTIADARKFWQNNSPQAIADGRVRLLEHSFFEPQPVGGAAVYILRHIMHDWSTTENRMILSQLSRAAHADSRAVIMDLIVPYTSASDEVNNDVKISQFQAPAPLLPSAGHDFAFDMDIHMLEMLNAQERTISDFTEMVEGSGWTIEQIYPGKLPGSPSKIVLGLHAAK